MRHIESPRDVCRAVNKKKHAQAERAPVSICFGECFCQRAVHVLAGSYKTQEEHECTKYEIKRLMYLHNVLAGETQPRHDALLPIHRPACPSLLSAAAAVGTIKLLTVDRTWYNSDEGKPRCASSASFLSRFATSIH